MDDLKDVAKQLRRLPVVEPDLPTVSAAWSTHVFALVPVDVECVCAGCIGGSTQRRKVFAGAASVKRAAGGAELSVYDTQHQDGTLLCGWAAPPSYR